MEPQCRAGSPLSSICKAIFSKHLGTICRQFEGCSQHIGRTAAHQHPLQEDLKVFVHAADIGVDLQVQRNDLFLGVDLQCLVCYCVIDPIMDVKGGFGLFAHTAAAHISKRSYGQTRNEV